MKLFFLAFLTAISSTQCFLFGGANSCTLMTPTNPDCCFMTDKDDAKSQNLPGVLPLHKSPYLMNLVSYNENGNDKSLNRLQKAEYRDDSGNSRQIWTLTPLMDDPKDSEKQIEGGPIRVEVSYCFLCVNICYEVSHN